MKRRQLSVARGDLAAGPCLLRHATAGHGAVHARRASRHAFDPRHRRGGSETQQMRAGVAHNGVSIGRYAFARFNLVASGRPSQAGATLSSGGGPRYGRWRGRFLAIDAMTTQDCTLSVGIVHGGLGQLRRDDPHWQSAFHGQASGRSRSWRREGAGPIGHDQRCHLRSDARRHAAGMGAQRRHDGALQKALAIAQALGAEFRMPVAISLARLEPQRLTAWESVAPMRTR